MEKAVHGEAVGFRPEFFDRLASREQEHWWFQARNRVLTWALRKRVPQLGSFLEVGCGTGQVLAALAQEWPGARLSGTELHAEGLRYARRRLPQARFEQLDARSLRSHARHEVIGAFDVIEHIEEDALVLNNLARALRPGGWLLVTVPQHRWLWSATDERACHVRRYTRGELLQKLQAAGLEVEYVNSFVSLLLPLMWVSRRRAAPRNQGDSATRIEAEMEVHPLLNRLLGGVMAFELALMKLGLPLPCGGSLLAVARKPVAASAAQPTEGRLAAAS